MHTLMSTVGADAPTSMELELLRDIALYSEDSSLRVALLIARSDAQLVKGAPLTQAVQLANVRCLQEIERWRATPAVGITSPRILDMATSAIRGSDYHALRICNLAISCPVRNATPEQELAVETCLSAWNSRAARLAGLAGLAS